MEEHQLAFATGRRLLKLLVQRNASLKIFVLFYFFTSCCNKQTIIHHEYRKRKLKSNALVLAIFMMIEREVEESKDQTAQRMFVEVFGDRESFLEAFLRELAKTDEVEQQMGRQPMRMNRIVSNALDDDFEPENLHLDNNESLNNLLNFFQSKDLTVLTR